MNRSRDYQKKVMEDLDALLDELQLTTAHISNKQPSFERISSTSSVGQNYQSSINQGGRSSQTPPPLPPPPQDIPDTIPPPQQFGDQPLYETQNIKQRDYNSVSGSSQSSSRGSGDQQYYYRDKSPGQQYPPQGFPYQPPGQQYQSNNQQFPPPPPQQQYQQHQQQQQQGMSMISNNLSELDQLLNDLNSAQFLAEVDKKHGTPGKVPPPVAPKPNRGGPSVDNLLDQLENSVPPSAGPHGGYPVQQSNSVNYNHQSQPEENGSVSYSHSSTSQSAATQELDNLMASLSDFKVKDKPQAQVNMPPPPRSPSPGSEPSYAKPHKSRNLSQSSSMNSSLQSNSITGNMSNNSGQGGQLETMLGDLQSDMNKQGVSTKTKGLCAACNQPVVGQVITALGKIWHIEHFTCENCQEPLGTKNFYERDNVAYCEKDYHALFAPKCSYCNGPIVDKCVTALNKTWHPEHFFCTLCGRPFGEDGFHEKDGKAYCKADFFEVFAPKCGGCARAIVDNYITALNRHWHPECFACWECRQPFGGGSFFDYEGLPYCETHYHAKRGSLCAGCQKPISGRCITAMHKKFHPEHFVCAFCLKQLNKGTFKEQNDRPYCHACFVKLFG